MKLKIVGLTALALSFSMNMKAQSYQGVEPSSFKQVQLEAKIPALGSDYTYDHKVTQVSIPGTKTASDNSFPTLIDESVYHELEAGAHKKAEDPNVLQSWEANTFNSFTPPDNTIAVSNGGQIISAMNSNIYYYDENGKFNGITTFVRLSKDYFNNASNDLFDPRLIYDQDQDRFILVVLSSHTPEDSKVLVFFSISNDPMDGWNGYSLPGDIEDKNDWFDYPNIAVNKNSLYITGNMFSEDDKFTESVIIEIGKEDGYNGNEISYRTWAGLQSPGGTAFSIVPVEKGDFGDYSDKAFFVCTDSGLDDYLMLFELNNESGQLESTTIPVPFYDRPKAAEQKDSDQELNMGDSRTKQAIRIGNVIHSVNATATINRYAAIAYHRTDLLTKTTKTKVFHRDNGEKSLGFPTIAASHSVKRTQDVLIAFTEASDKMFPSLSFINVDADAETSSMVEIQPGTDFVDILDDDQERWGDYITLANRFNNNTVWLFGCVGGDGNNHENYICELSLDQIASTPKIKSTSSTASVFPNPVREQSSLRFDIDTRQFITIQIYNEKGQLIENLLKDTYNPGGHQLTLNTTNYQSGTYIINITGKEGLIAQKKIVKL